MSEERQIVLEVVEELSSQLSTHHPTPNLASHLEVDLGLGSLERLELVRRLEARLGRTLDEGTVFQARLVQDLLSVGSRNGQVAPRSLGQRTLPARPNQAATINEALLYQASQQPDQVAMVILEADQEVARPTYCELLEGVRRVGSGLLAQGLRPGERVALMLPTGLEFFQAFLGALWVGVVPVPLYPPLRLDQAEDFLLRQQAILGNCGAEVIVSLPQLSPVFAFLKGRTSLKRWVTVRELALQAAAPEGPAGSESLAFLQYTSGSTGDPKGVALTHRNLLTNIWDIGTGFGMGSGDVMVSWLPLYHDMGLIGTSLGSLCHGLPVVLMGPDQFLARPERWLRAFSDYRGTMTAAPNFAYSICAHKIDDQQLEGIDLSCWRIALNGAEPVLEETIQAFCQRYQSYGFRPEAMFPAYGLAEATLAVTFTPLGRGARVERIDRLHLQESGQVVAGTDPVVSSGVPLESFEVRVTDREGQVLKEGFQGEVEIRGDSVMAGYFGQAPRQGLWHPTGDLGFLLDGELFLTGRLKDLVVVAGRNFHPNDIEASVARIKGVRPGSIVALGSKDQGSERLVILAEARNVGPDLAQEIARVVRQETGLQPVVELLPPRTLPKTPSGKLRRREAARRFEQDELRPPQFELGWLIRLAGAWMGTAWQRLAQGARLGQLVFWSLGGWLALLAGRPVGRTIAGVLTRLGISIEVRGQLPQQGPVCLVCNHSSLLDPLILLALYEGDPLCFVNAESNAEHPLLRPLKRQDLVIRRGVGQAASSLESLVEALREGRIVVVFPEGGIEYCPGLRGFATGAFQACARTGTAVLPVALSGTRRLMPQGSFLPKAGRVQVSVLETLSAEGDRFDQVAALTREVRNSLAEQLREGPVESRLARCDGG